MTQQYFLRLEVLIEKAGSSLNPDQLTTVCLFTYLVPSHPEFDLTEHSGNLDRIIIRKPKNIFDAKIFEKVS